MDRSTEEVGILWMKKQYDRAEQNITQITVFVNNPSSQKSGFVSHGRSRSVVSVQAAEKIMA